MQQNKGFTLLEIMIVISIISILGAAIFPSITQYLASARDSDRVVNVRTLAGVFQVYRNVNEALPNNFSGSASYCVTEILNWANGSGPDRQYEELGDNFTIIPTERHINIPTFPCIYTGSYLYSRLIDATAIQYGVLATRMETANSITYLTGTDFISPLHISKIIQADKIQGLNVLELSGSLAPIYHMEVH